LGAYARPGGVPGEPGPAGAARGAAAGLYDAGKSLLWIVRWDVLTNTTGLLWRGAGLSSLSLPGSTPLRRPEMKTATNSAKGTKSDSGTRTAIATQELKERIRASRLGDVLAGMACDLCLEQVPVEEALQMIQERAIERMVAMLDTAILSDEVAMQCCLDIVARESEQVALQALEKGTDALREGLEIYDELQSAECTGPVN